MKKILIISFSIGICLLLVISNAGCVKKVATEILEEAVGMEASGEVDIEVKEGEVKITSEEGDVQIIGEDVPADWPSVVPIHKNIVFDSVFSAEQDGKKGWSILFAEIKGSAQDLYQYYKNEFSGWDVVIDELKDKDDGTKEYNFRVSNGTYIVVVWIEESDSESRINLAVNEE